MCKRSKYVNEFLSLGITSQNSKVRWKNCTSCYFHDFVGIIKATNNLPINSSDDCNIVLEMVIHDVHNNNTFYLH